MNKTKKNIKTKTCNEFIKSGFAEPYVVIDHSYTDGGGRDMEKLIESKDNICPCLTTRSDTLGVVVIYEEK